MGSRPRKQRSRREVDLPPEVAQQHEPDGDAVHKDKLPPVRLQHVKKDALLGEVCQDFYSVLKKHCGRCHKMDLCLPDSKNGASPSDTKIATLHIVLDGLTVELRQIPAASPSVVSITFLF